MSLANRFTLSLALSGLALLGGCVNNNNGPAPNPQGFTNSNLSGTYVFLAQGFDSGSPNGAGPLTIAGALVADGSGHITGGTMDAVDPLIEIDTNQPITSGTYFVNSDGRGQAALNTGIGNFTLDFVLTAASGAVSSHGLVTEFDGNGSGSGTLDLQTAIAGQGSIAGPYAFTVAGSDNSGNGFASAGAFVLNSGGTMTAGVEDFNDANVPTLNQSLTGSALLGSGTGPGTLTLATSFGTLIFDFYPVDATHFKVVEIDTNEFLAGDVFSQTGATIPSGPMAFTMSGGIAFAVGNGGVMTSDGAGNFSNGLEDSNIDGTVTTQAPFTGLAAAGVFAGGRVVVDLSGFNPAIQWVIYPSTGGLLLLESDALNTTIGTAYAQTAGATLSTTQGYGLNLGAFNNQGQYVENDIAEFASASSNYSGAIDISDDDGTGFGISLSPNLAFGVSFTGPDSTGSGSATTTVSGSSYFSFNYYMVDDSTALLLETDTNQIGTGVFGLQSSSGSGVSRRGAWSLARPLGRAKLTKNGKQVKRNQGRFH